jgi:hypothetical protein
MSDKVGCTQCHNEIGPEEKGRDLVHMCHFCLRARTAGPTDWEAEARYYRKLALERGDELTKLKFPDESDT